jgi:hypothetical protein
METPTVSNPGPELQEADIRTNVEAHNEGVEFEPLFDDEKVSEEELKGTTEENTADSESKGDEGGESKQEEGEKEPEKEDPKEDDSEKEPEKEPEKEEASNEDKKPPAGFVPQEALHQERQKGRALRSEIQRLSAENQMLKTPKPEEGAFADFKVLSDQEFEALQDDDPDEAQLYLHKLNKYNAHQMKVSDQKRAAEQAQQVEMQILNESVEALEAILPGVTQGKNELADKLTEFATTHGIDDGVLEVLTNPGTRVTTTKGENLLLAGGAVQFVDFVKSAYEALSKAPNEADLRKEIEAELRPAIEAEVQKSLMEKLQNDPTTFKSLDEVPGSGEKSTNKHTGYVTEAELARMSPEEERALLGG